jgi:capsular polysaccharide biosynthesis protein/tetratricopeptide (TPR) repeat protein
MWQFLNKTLWCSQDQAAINQLGEILFEQHRWSEAIALYEQAIALYPNSASLYNYLGYAQWQLGNTAAAISSYYCAIELDPNLASTYYNLGKIWQSENDFAAAVACFIQVIKLQPNYIPIYSDLGYSLMAEGKLTEAMACFREAIARQPLFVESFCDGVEQRLVGTKTELDDFALAKIACAKFLRALQQQFDAPEVLKYLLETYVRLGNAVFDGGGYRQAAIYYEYALQIQPDNATANWQLGQIREKQGIWQEAIACYRRVLASDVGAKLLPEFPKAESAIFPQGIYQFTQDWLDCYRQNARLGNDNFGHISDSRQKSDRLYTENVVTACQAKYNDEKTCEGVNCQSCLSQINRWFNPVNLANGLYQVSYPCYPNELINYPIFVANIPNGRVWIAPQKSSWQICNAIAVITPDNYLLDDLSRCYPGQLPGCENYDPRKHRIFQIETLPKLTEVDGTVAILSGLSGHVYFHWLVDILPRWELLRLSGVDLTKIDWFVVNSLRQPFQRETLEYLGISESKIIESDRYPHIQAQQLVVPSFPGFLGWLPPWALQFLRSQFLGFFGNGLEFSEASSNNYNYPERIYISREKAQYRRVINEPEVWETLKKFGFAKIFLESYSVREQIRLFAHAKMIITAHGSGLTNIIFCQPNTEIMELASPNYIKHYFWVISQQLGLKHYYLVGESFACYPLRYIMDPNPLTENILVNIDGLKKALSVLGLP